jgi:hypothetical protein
MSIGIDGLALHSPHFLLVLDRSIGSCAACCPPAPRPLLMESDVLPTPQSDLYAILKLCCTYTSDTASLLTPCPWIYVECAPLPACPVCRDARHAKTRHPLNASLGTNPFFAQAAGCPWRRRFAVQHRPYTGIGPGRSTRACPAERHSSRVASAECSLCTARALRTMRRQQGFLPCPTLPFRQSCMPFASDLQRPNART